MAEYELNYEGAEIDSLLEEVIKSRIGYFIGRDLIDFDFDNSVIKFPVGYIVKGKTYYTPNPQSQEVEIASPTTDGLRLLIYNTTTYTFSEVLYSGWSALGDNEIVVAFFWAGVYNVVIGPSSPMMNNGRIPGPKFNADNVRLLLPNNMYFINEEPLQLYKSSILSISDLDFMNTVKMCLLQEDTSPQPNNPSIPSYDYFDEKIELDATNLLDSFQIIMKQSKNRGYDYYTPITKNSVASASLASKTPKIQFIGDSILNRYIQRYVKYKLDGYSVSASLVGTISQLGGYNGEAREGWEFANFIGKDNTHTNTTTITRLTSGSSSTIYQNPFLKEADSDDKTNHPAWCFLNTSADSEQSYEDTQTGTFYIFDYSWYLSAHSITSPEVIIIGLGTNDMTNENNENSLAQSRLGLEIMLKQIKTALPTVKIGVIPAFQIGPALSAQWNSEAATWIENCMKDIETFALSDVYICPTWCHTNRDFNWSYSGSVDLNSTSNEQVGTINDSIHPNDRGRWEYVRSIVAFIANMI